MSGRYSRVYIAVNYVRLHLSLIVAQELREVISISMAFT